MANLGAAYVMIAANLDNFQKGLKEAKSGTNKFLKDVNSALSIFDFSPLVKNIGMIGLRLASITAPITATGAALYAIAQRTANLGDELLKMHEKTGISVEELYSLKKVAEMADSSIGEMSVSLKFLSQNLVEAKDKTSEASRIFDAMNIDTTKPLMEVFKDVAKTFAKYEDGAEKIALATKIFGKSGQEIIPVLNEINKSGIELSETFNEEAARAADQFNDNITELKQNISDLTYRIGNKLIPTMNTFFDVVKAGGGEKYKSEWLNQLKRDIDSLDTLQGKGITSIRDAPFMFDGKAYSPKESVPEFTKDDTAKREKEEQRTAHAIAGTYKDMYETLKFDTGKYYDYRKGLLEKQREEEIKVTGDATLAWEAYHARLAELDEQRLERSNKVMDGVRLFMAEETRRGTTTANAVKDALQSAKQSGISNIASLMKDIETGAIKGKNAFKAMAQSMLGSFLDAANQMIAKWIMMKIIGLVAGMFGNLGSTGTTSSMGGTSSSAGSWGITSGSHNPSPFAMPTRATGGGGGGVVINQNISIPISAMDSQDVDRVIRKGGHNAIRKIMANSVTQSDGYAKLIRGK
eukprot:GHVR01003824.1.p1 GENE.GHVR01003824.1~~GHVR01003824.1.p1  ORF type:complete len:580 (-),score=42.36 GHVR01003824.1:89-1828(-)